ncbi:hypothetical protein JXI42_05560 [bacterium]|nr:hypothetical protein [bacterium]
MINKTLAGLIILSALVTLLAITGCGKTYQGKYITTVIDEEPMDEFKVDNFVVLVAQNENRREKEGWFYKFFVYENGKQIRLLRLMAKVVNKRAFYLEEKTDDKLKNHVYFDTEPTYEVVKNRVVALLKAGE